jgi:hypothetical protein
MTITLPDAEAPLFAAAGQTTKRGINIDWLNVDASPRPSDLMGVNWVRLIAHPHSSVHPDPARADETLCGHASFEHMRLSTTGGPGWHRERPRLQQR